MSYFSIDNEYDGISFYAVVKLRKWVYLNVMNYYFISLKSHKSNSIPIRLLSQFFNR